MRVVKNILKTSFFFPFNFQTQNNEKKTVWVIEIQMAVTAYGYGNCGLNECSRVYGVPIATARRHGMNKGWDVNG
jgi:hypothetical protein